MSTIEENPLAEGLERLPVHPTTLVIFGATGDLARGKLLPAAYNLAHEGALPERFNLIGTSRRELSDDEYRQLAREWIEAGSRTTPDPAVLDGLLQRIRYVPVEVDQPHMYEALAELADSLDYEAGEPFNRVFYLSTAPEHFPTIVGTLASTGLGHHPGADVRVVIEKPFGTDLASALELNQAVHEAFEEEQVYRIDHYLGKETVQNLLAFRFGNSMFEQFWNRNFIDHVQITAAELVGVGTRAGYYEKSGALRDLVQNHLLQLLTLLCMEPPASFEADKVRDEKVKVLEAIAPTSPDDVPGMSVRAQYGSGIAGAVPCCSYLDEEDVELDSTTETYAALRLVVQNWRWAGVPFYLRTGKRLARRLTEIAVTLKPVPHLAFQHEGASGPQPNRLVMTIQPDEGVSLSIGAKIPGASMRIRPVNMEFRYGTTFVSQSPEAYERLILDAMRGSATLFTREDEVSASWAVVDPILQAWDALPGPLPQYAAGSDGPVEANDLLLGDTEWRAI